MSKQLVYSKDISIDNLCVGLKYVTLVISGRIYKNTRKFLGWPNWCHYDSKKDAKEDAKMLEKNGYIIDWYL